MTDYIRWFNEISSKDIHLVGGKNASLGELITLGLPVPAGFAVTSSAYDRFVKENGLNDFIENQLAHANTSDVQQLEVASKNIRGKIHECGFPKDLKDAIISNYEKLYKTAQESFSCAVRSSATAEDLPTASFAGQQETFLNVKGEEEILQKIKECFGSLFTSRAIFYRKEKGFSGNVKMSVGIQKLVNSEKSGVIFTVEPNSGNGNVLVIDSGYGLGEFVVSGKVVPDQFFIFRPTKNLIRKKIADKKLMLIPDSNGTKSVDVPENRRIAASLTNDEIRKLSEYALLIQSHYNRQMDIEWAAENSTIYILQARPETVHSNALVEETYKLEEEGKEVVSGIAIGSKIACGKVKVLPDTSEMHKFDNGDILVTRMTTPDWIPILNKASAIITEEGGTTSHAAIVSRELGIPCVVGACDAIKILSKYENQEVTIDCSEGVGRVYEGRLKFVKETVDMQKLAKTRTQIMMNASRPDAALHHASKCEGVGLLRLEFVYAHEIGIHPLALINYNRLKEKAAANSDSELERTLLEIEDRTKGYENKEDFFVEKLSEGIALIAAAVYPSDVIVRFSDFRTNEYRGLIGGYLYESEESNPMLGWRGASRYVHPSFEPAFRLECRTIKAVREKGLKNIIPMIPFCRTTRELERILQIMEDERLKKGEIKVYLMAEIPSNIWNAEEFSRYVDGFSIGSNDLTQLILGVDRDSSSLAKATFDERDTAVKKAISYLIKTAHANGKKVGICGQAPSDYPEFVEFLIKEGIDSISLNPDVLLKTRKLVADIESMY